jgi:hypothetical protein
MQLHQSALENYPTQDSYVFAARMECHKQKVIKQAQR